MVLLRLVLPEQSQHTVLHIYIEQHSSQRVKTQSTFLLAGHKVPYIIHNNFIFFRCPDFLEVTGIKKHVKKEGYKYIERKLHLKGLNSNEVFLRTGKIRNFIRIDAAIVLATERKTAKETEPNLFQNLISFLNEKAHHSQQGGRGCNQSYHKEKKIHLNRKIPRQRIQKFPVGKCPALPLKNLNFMVLRRNFFSQLDWI